MTQSRTDCREQGGIPATCVYIMIDLGWSEVKTEEAGSKDQTYFLAKTQR